MLDVDVPVDDPKELLLAEHRKQKKELRAKIQALKKGVHKNDKARVKEMRKEIETMEAELKEKQDEELCDFEKTISIKAVDNLAEKVNDVNISAQKNKEAKISKTQKKRNKREAKAKEVSARFAQAEADYVNSARFTEEKQIEENLKKMDLMVKPIPSDGNCMYSAIQDQLNPNHVVLSVDALRKQASTYIRENKHDFLPFLTNKNTGDMFTEEEFEDYCSEIEKPSTWGGQIELLALSRALRAPIHVVQANAALTVHGEEFNSTSPIILTFHRYELGLGEHYNSVQKLVEDDAML